MTDDCWSSHARAISLLIPALAVVFGAGCTDASESNDPETGTADVRRDAADIGTNTRDGGDPKTGPSGDAADGGDVEDVGVEEIEIPPVFSVEAHGFTTSEDCSACHSNADGSDAMRGPSGEAVGMYDLWRASMMANAARDPFWRAQVSAEVKKSPDASEKIEDKCLTCHTPMAHRATRRAGNSKLSMDIIGEQSDLGNLARDGVSCAACHQIEPDGLGQPESFTGGFVISETKKAYGPYEDVHAEPMKNRSGFETMRGDHMLDSSLCGSCHTLYTDPIDSAGNSTAAAHFPEQTPFLEWKNSQYYSSREGGDTECQDCHEPTTDAQGEPIETQIANTKFGGDYPLEKVPERSPYGRHLFIGGNTLVPAILRDHSDALNPSASDQAFDALIEKVERQLRERTADVEVVGATRERGRLEVRVGIETLTGHKFPTGYPSRRAWLHVEVSSNGGESIFESGGVDSEGRIVGGEGDVLASETPSGPVVPHRNVVDSQDQVQIYQSLMEDADGEVTWRLMRAADYRKDNRLLPKGWSSEHPAMEDIGPVGADSDSNFAGGGDQVLYRVDLPPSASGPFQVNVELYYQVLSHRFASELFQVETRAVQVFRTYWEEADRQPIAVDSATVTVD